MNWLELDGQEVFVHSESTICGNVKLGRYSAVGKGAFVVGVSPVVIGSFCTLGEGFVAHTHQDHMTFLPSTFIFGPVLGIPWSRGTGMAGVDEEFEEVDPAPISIGNDVQIGTSVTVRGGGDDRRWVHHPRGFASSW